MKNYKVVQNASTQKFDVVDETGAVVQSGLERAAADTAANQKNAEQNPPRTARS